MTNPNQVNRLTSQALIDRDQRLSFTFDGVSYTGYAGDTLASALLANGVRLMGRSFKYHRPRGPLTAGSEEPNALVHLRTGAATEPNTRATTVELYDGLVATSQNAWPSLKHDALAMNDKLSRFLGAGFYYKTFMWPKSFWEKVYEPTIRNAAGLGRLSMADDPDSYDKGFLHCDLLVIGGGPAGLMAALTAGRAGARVIIADEDPILGGRLNAETIEIDGHAGSDWAATAVTELLSLPSVTLLPRTTVLGAFDHGIYSALERNNDHVLAPAAGKPRQTLWRIYSKRAILAAGATERMIAFPQNDRPGIMTASALRTYVNRYAVAPSRHVVVFTNNSDGHRTAVDLIEKGIDVVAVVDVRPNAQPLGMYRLIAGGTIISTSGRLGLTHVMVKHTDGLEESLLCGALGVSGGWNPAVSLMSHHRGRPVWQEAIAAFGPGKTGPEGLSVAGAASGVFSTHGALNAGQVAANFALKKLDFDVRPPAPLPQTEDTPYRITPYWTVPDMSAKDKGKAWIDAQNDVTVKDIQMAHQEGFQTVEHLKRYTTLGMATDQGKTSNALGLAVMAAFAGQDIPAVGTTMYRPPYVPVALGALAGRSTGKHFKPTRKTPSHKWATENGATFVEVGNWLRAQWFTQPGETTWRQSVDREARAVRESVGVCDVTTLGKVDVQGPDAATFLNKVYANGFAKLPVGKTRYGLMLREDGMALDDGTAARMAEDHFVVTTTTANAVGVYRHMEFVRQCLYPNLDVQIISTTEAWAQFAVAGPNSRAVLQKIVDPAFDLSNDGFPFMACGEITVCGGLRARLFRISFSGELAYEIAVPTRYGDALVRAIMAAGAEFDITPYGTEALGVLRIEKGHAAGNELNGQISAEHLGMGRMVSRTKDSIGAPLSLREGITDPHGVKLIGLKPTDPQTPVPAGAHLITTDQEVTASNNQGWVSSAAYSPNLNSYIALAFLKQGDQRLGETITVVNPLQNETVTAEVVSPHFIDPEGARLRV